QPPVEPFLADLAADVGEDGRVVASLAAFNRSRDRVAVSRRLDHVPATATDGVEQRLTLGRVAPGRVMQSVRLGRGPEIGRNRGGFPIALLEFSGAGARLAFGVDRVRPEIRHPGPRA